MTNGRQSVKKKGYEMRKSRHKHFSRLRQLLRKGSRFCSSTAGAIPACFFSFSAIFSQNFSPFIQLCTSEAETPEEKRCPSRQSPVPEK